MNKLSEWLKLYENFAFSGMLLQDSFSHGKKEDSGATRISISKHMLFWRHAKTSDLFYVSYFVLELFEMCTSFYKVYML